MDVVAFRISAWATGSSPVVTDERKREATAFLRRATPPLQLAPQRVIHRVTATAFGQEHKRYDEDQQRVFEAA